MEQIKPGTKLSAILNWIQDIGGSDLHLQEQKPARYRIEGRLNVVDEATLPRLSKEQIIGLLADNFSPAATGVWKNTVSGP